MTNKEYIVSNKQFRETKHGKTFISMTLTSNDLFKTKADGKIWSDNIDKLKDSFNNGDIIKVTDGKEDSYNNMPQIIINKIEVVGQIVWGLSLEEAKNAHSELINFIESNIFNEQAKTITLKTLEKYSRNPSFLQAPAAKTHHHNYPGGLLKHTLELCILAKSIKDTNLYTDIEWDIVFSACVLHDLGKIHDYKIESGTVTTTEAIKLTGHLVTTPLEMYDTAKNLGLEQTPVFNNILHAVVAHHGKKEYGSPQTPNTNEAWIVHLVDMISSQLGNND